MNLQDEELERVEAFKYLGCLVSFENNDLWAVNANLQKACSI